MTEVHPTAIVAPTAELGDNVTIGPYAVIEENVKIGDGTTIYSSALIAGNAELGKNVRVFHSAVIGTEPQDLKFEGEETKAVIGDDTTIREFVTINRGTAASGQTILGKNCLLMAYAHVAHDCIVGDNVIMANSVNTGGHVEIGDFAICGGVLAVHQFVKIGAHAMIGGGFRVSQDVCPYAMVSGYPLKVVGLNSIGLRRRKYSVETRKTLEKAFKLLFFADLNTAQALDRIKQEVQQTPQVQELTTFVSNSTRGLVK